MQMTTRRETMLDEKEITVLKSLLTFMEKKLSVKKVYLYLSRKNQILIGKLTVKKGNSSFSIDAHAANAFQLKKRFLKMADLISA